MTEEQRKDAMMALGRIVLSIEGLKMDYKQDVQTIIYALQSPPVPVIEGLEQAMQLLIMIGDSYSREAEKCRIIDMYSMVEYLKEKSNMIRKCVKVCKEYSKLQKGE